MTHTSSIGLLTKHHGYSIKRREQPDWRDSHLNINNPNSVNVTNCHEQPDWRDSHLNINNPNGEGIFTYQDYVPHQQQYRSEDVAGQHLRTKQFCNGDKGTPRRLIWAESSRVWILLQYRRGVSFFRISDTYLSSWFFPNVKNLLSNDKLSGKPPNTEL